jgi:L-methionine (R)-S-oxide reductase
MGSVHPTVDVNQPKDKVYEQLIAQINALISGEKDMLANMANICAILHHTFNWHWTGFYIVKVDELVLGPFQGPVACTRIGYGKGVCGNAWKEKQTIIVKNVHEFPGHIACSAYSNSEIVVPIIQDEKVIAVLDVDSEHYSHFDEIDKKYLEQIAELIQENY